jgi:hypothetical protein
VIRGRSQSTLQRQLCREILMNTRYIGIYSDINDIKYVVKYKIWKLDYFVQREIEILNCRLVTQHYKMH